jgi:hypothetical protein
MGNKILSIPHHVDDGECMWNGIEDLYIQKSGEKIPNQFFFCLSGKGNFIYLKFNKGELKRRIAWGDGRVKQMYKEISDIVGFKYKHIEGRTFGYAMKVAKEQIDMGYPVVLGCLDMYCLKYYPKFYKKEHIPIHYVLMIGYDDDRESAYLLDCGIKSVQEISYELLEEAMNVETKGLSLKNTVCTITFEKDVKSTLEIAKEGFYRKAKKMLESPVGFAGIRGMYKLAKEFPDWQGELTQEDYETVLQNAIMFSGTVPKMPNRMLGVEEADDIRYMCGREHMSSVLSELGKEYQIPAWREAAELFLESGDILEKMAYEMTEYLMKDRTDLQELPQMMISVAQIEENAYRKILLGIEQE